MTLEAMTIGREARIMIGSDTYCWGQFQNSTTREIIKNPDTICGDIDHPVNRNRKGRKIARFMLMLDPTPAVLTALVPWLGLTDETGGVYSFGAADALVEKDVKLAVGAAQHNYTNTIVLGYAFRASKGGRPMSLQLSLEAEDETETAIGSAFADNPLTINKIYAFNDIVTRQLDDSGGTLTSRPIDRFLLQVDNGVVSEWNSSTTRTSAKIGARQAIMATSVPYNSTHKDLYWIYRDSEGAVEAKVKFTNADGSVEFFAQAGTPITKGPSVLGKMDQVRTPVTLDLCRTDSAGTRVSPLKITLS
jgi:hypothetical protein